MSPVSAPYRGRFAPTPSGPLHFGSLIAALGSYLDAKAHNGQWHLRIDDLDPPRVAPGAIDAILRTLDALGFEWDGPIVYQSRRAAAYHAALHELRQRHAIYPCCCSRSEIEAIALRSPEGPIYPGTCSNGMPPGRRARTWRIRVDDIPIEFDDGLQGRQRFDLAKSSGDFSLYRAEGVYAFHLASAVDDIALAMTDIVRGADLLESSARQLYVMNILRHSGPRYVHLPVAVDRYGAKLSKQTGADPLNAQRPVAALYAALRFLNQPLPPEREHTALSELWTHAVAHWDLAKVGQRREAPLPP